MEKTELDKEVILTSFEYETLLIKLEDDYYIPTEQELHTDYVIKDYRFFIIRKKGMNHVVYYDDLD